VEGLVRPAILPKIEHFSSFDSDFAKNGAFFKFRQRFWQKSGTFQVSTAIWQK